jgi:hypothetical protein
VESRLRVGIIFYGRRFSRRELRKEGLVLKTLPQHANRYGRPRSERLADAQEAAGGPALNIDANALLASQCSRYSECSLAKQTEHTKHAKTSIIYRCAYGAALGAPLWSTQLHSLEL